MQKVRITIDIDARPFSQEEAEEQAKLVGCKPEDLIDHEIDAFGIGQCIASHLDAGCGEALAGSNIMVHLGAVSLVDAELKEEDA